MADEQVINLKELSERTGKSEFELAKTIVTILAIKAEVTGETQHLHVSLKK